MAGLLTHTWTQSIKNDTGSSVVAGGNVPITGNQEENFKVLVAKGTTVEVDIAIDVSQIQSGFIAATGPCSINTNASDASGGQTITINDPTNKGAYAWNNIMAGMGACPFTPDITKFYITNSSTTTDITVRGGFLLLKP